LNAADGGPATASPAGGYAEDQPLDSSINSNSTIVQNINPTKEIQTKEIQTVHTNTVTEHTNTVVVDEDTKNKVNLLLRQLDSDRPNYSVGQTYALPANLLGSTLNIGAGSFTISANGDANAQNLTAEHDLTVRGNFSVAGTQAYTGAANFTSASASSTLTTTNTGTGFALQADNITAKTNTLNTTTGNLILNSNTGLVEIAGTGIKLTNAVPSDTSMALYNDSGTLKWNGAALAMGSSVSGTIGYLPKFTASNALGNSVIYESGGNVGVGTTSPGRLLDVAGNVRFDSGSGTNSIVLRDVTISKALGSGVTFDSTLATSVGNPGGPAYSFASDRDTGMFEAAANQIGFSLGGSERMRIDNAGNVGIGTTAPAAKLDIKSSGTASLPLQLTASDGSILFDIYEGSSGDGQLDLYNSAGTPNVLLRGINGGASYFNSGNVGIGTTGPGTELHVVHKGVSQGGLKISSDQNGNYLQLGGDFPYMESYGATMYLNMNNSQDINMRNGAMIVKSTGNVGIGTTAPAGKLNVVGQTILGVVPFGLNWAPSVGDNQLFLTSNTNPTLNTGTTLSLGGRYRAADNGQISYGSIAGLKENNSDSNANGFMAFYTSSESEARSSERMRISSAGNVGIGTTTPGDKLDILSAFRVTGNAGYTSARIYDGGSVDQGWIDLNSSGVTKIQLTGDAAQPSYFNAGNVGIGTTAPGQKLEVHDGNILLSRNDGGRPGFLMTYGSNNWMQAIQGDGRLDIFNSNNMDGTALMTLKSGNVGIGTTAPSQMLSVGASNQFTVNSSGNVVVGSSITGTGGLTLYGGGSSVAMGSTLYMGLNSISFGSPHIINSSYGLNIGSGTTAPIKINGGALLVGYTSSGESYPAGNAIISGNVGIGTTAPGYKLDVAGNFNVSNSNSYFGGSAKGQIYFNTNEINSMWADNGNSDLWINYSGYQNGATQFRDTRIADGKHNTILFVDGSAGNVGIGTTAPAYKLDVAGDIRSTNNIYATGNIKVGAGNGLMDTFNSQQRVLVGDSYVAINTTNGSQTVERFRIDNQGNVGIGTTAPGGKLQVSGDIVSTGAASTVISSSAVMDYYGSGLRLISRGSNTSTRGNFTFWQESSDGTLAQTPIYINSSGNVGIGTTAPGDKLEVNDGNIFISKVGGQLKVKNLWTPYNIATIDFKNWYAGSEAMRVNMGDGNYWYFTDNGGIIYNQNGDQGYFRVGSNGNLYMSGKNIALGSGWLSGDGDSEGIFVSSAGNVGIGTTAPGAKLDVYGASTGHTLVGALSNATGYGAIGFASTLTSSNYALSSLGQDTLLNAPDGYYIGFHINNAEKVRINSAGNVGIGTTSPGAILDVRKDDAVNDQMIRLWNDLGVAKMRFASSDASESMHQWTSHSSWIASIAAKYNATADNQYLQFRVLGTSGTNTEVGLAAATKMTILGSGNVGIGTTAPAAKLQVVGNIMAFTQEGTQYGVYAGGGDGLGNTLSAGMVGANGSNVVKFGAYLNGTAETGYIALNRNGNVGIGASNPGARLQVTGVDSLATSFAANLSGATGTGLVVLNSGNVGIGTTAPGAVLDVFKTGTNDPLARFGSSGSSDSQSIAVKNGLGAISLFAAGGVNAFLTGAVAGDTGIRWAPGTKFHLGVQAGSGPSLTADSSGNVGIGTTSPEYTLDVNGTIRSLNTAGASSVTSESVYDGTVHALLAGRASRGTLTSALPLLENDYIAYFSAGGNGATGGAPAYGNSVGVFGFYAAGNFTPTSKPTYFTIETTPSGSVSRAERVRISSDGNVGIGTASPAAKLSIRGVSGATDETVLELVKDSSWGVNEHLAIDWKDPLTVNPLARIAAEASAAGNWGLDFYTTNDGGANLLNRMRISSSGNVGIGTTALANNTKLGILGNGISIGDPSTATDASLHIKASYGGIDRLTQIHPALIASKPALNLMASTSATPAYQWWVWGVDTDNKWKINSGTSFGTGLAMTGAGNVGIGTTNPQQKLHVYRSTDGAPVRFEDANGYCEIDPTTTTWTCTSDASMKTDITGLSAQDMLQKIVSLRGVNFRWKTQATDALRYGFIAQDVEKVFPEFVSTDENGLKSVAYGAFTPAIIEAIKYQQKQIDGLKLVLGPTGALSDASSTSEFAQGSGLFDWLVNSLNSMGLALKDGVASLKEIAVDTLTANKVKTKQVCVVDSLGNDICVTGDQLKQFLQASGAAVSTVKENPGETILTLESALITQETASTTAEIAPVLPAATSITENAAQEVASSTESVQ